MYHYTPWCLRNTQPSLFMKNSQINVRTIHSSTFLTHKNKLFPSISGQSQKNHPVINFSQRAIENFVSLDRRMKRQSYTPPSVMFSKLSRNEVCSTRIRSAVSNLFHASWRVGAHSQLVCLVVALGYLKNTGILPYDDGISK